MDILDLSRPPVVCPEYPDFTIQPRVIPKEIQADQERAADRGIGIIPLGHISLMGDLVQPVPPSDKIN